VATTRAWLGLAPLRGRLYVGRLSQECGRHERRSRRRRLCTSSWAQIAGTPADISSYTRRQLHPGLGRAPFLQIGESKYGKFMLELAVEARWTCHRDQDRLSSMVSAARATSRRPPYDLGLYRNDSLDLNEFRFPATLRC